MKMLRKTIQPVNAMIVRLRNQRGVGALIPLINQMNAECGSINSFDKSDECRVLFEHHACFAHVLQLVVKDGMAKAGKINAVSIICAQVNSIS